MLAYINTHLSSFWIALGFALLVMEVAIFGFGAIIFLFAGIGALVAGLLLEIGVLPETWIASTACFGLATGLSAALLWKPFKKLQNKNPPTKDVSSDFIGLNFVLAQTLSVSEPASHPYSGITWKVELDSSSELKTIDKGERVEVVSIDVGIFRVKKLV